MGSGQRLDHITHDLTAVLGDELLKLGSQLVVLCLCLLPQIHIVGVAIFTDLILSHFAGIYVDSVKLLIQKLESELHMFITQATFIGI